MQNNYVDQGNGYLYVTTRILEKKEITILAIVCVLQIQSIGHKSFYGPLKASIEAGLNFWGNEVSVSHSTVDQDDQSIVLRVVDRSRRKLPYLVNFKGQKGVLWLGSMDRKRFYGPYTSLIKVGLNLGFSTWSTVY
uniref:Uncharacterized protein n=1 Tax=Solanum tuberosum TaxID=4113 RepID=M1DAB1_SOLTU